MTLARPAPQRILLVSLDNLGDAVMASAILRPIKRAYPQARIGLWVKQYAAGLFVDHSLVDAVHASDPFWDKSPGTDRGRLGEFLKVLGEIRRARYDVAVILNTEWRRSLACLAAAISERVGTDRRQSRPFLTAAFPGPAAGGHFIDDHRVLIEQWSGRPVAVEDCLPRLELTAQDEKAWAAWSAATGFLDRAYALIHLFSGDEDKNWPLSCWVELVERRLQKDPRERFVLLCGPGEDRKLAMFRSRMDREGILLMTAPPLGLLKAVLGHARLALGGDSGPGHVAAALGTPLLSLFGKTDPRRSRPLGRGMLHVIHSSPLRFLPVPEVEQALDKFFSRV